MAQPKRMTPWRIKLFNIATPLLVAVISSYLICEGGVILLGWVHLIY